MINLRPEIDIRDGIIGQKKYDEKQKHIMQEMQNNNIYKSEENKMKSYSMLFGSHLPMKLTIERNLLSQDNAPLGSNRCNLGLDIHMNRLQKVDFNDFLNKDSPDLQHHNAQSLFLKNY